jgi:hypothetical protein
MPVILRPHRRSVVGVGIVVLMSLAACGSSATPSPVASGGASAAPTGGPTAAPSTGLWTPEPTPAPTPSPTSAPPDFLVTVTTDDPDSTPGDGICDTGLGKDGATACSLRAAVQESEKAGAARVIALAPGTYALRAGDSDEDANANGDLDIRGTIEIRGTAAATTIIDGRGKTRLLQVFEGGSLTLRGLTLQGGHAVGDARQAWNAGAISSRGTLDLEGVRVMGNTGREPGAILSTGSLTARDSQFVGNVTKGPPGNETGDGGALVITGTALFENAVFQDNISSSGGGAIVAEDADVVIRASRFAGNRADAGGAITFGGGTLTIEATTFEANRAEFAGAIDVASWGSPTVARITATTFRGNTATTKRFGGGAILNRGGELWITGSLFTGNVSLKGNGGAIAVPTGVANIATSTFDHDQAGGSGSAISMGDWSDAEGKRTTPYAVSIGWTTLVATATSVYRQVSGQLAGDTVSITGSIVIADSGASACAGAPVESGGGNLGDTACGFTGTGDAAAVRPEPSPGASPSPTPDPSAPPFDWLLGPLADNGGPTLSRLPVAGSLAVDFAQGLAGCPPLDQRGIARPIGLACDAGSVEARP